MGGRTATPEQTDKPSAHRAAAAFFQFPQLLRKSHDYFFKPDPCFLNTWDPSVPRSKYYGKGIDSSVIYLPLF